LSQFAMLLLLERLNLPENRRVNVNSGSWHDAVMLNYVASDIKPRWLDAFHALCSQDIMSRVPVTHAGKTLGSSINETNQTDQINKITIFRCGLPSSHRELFHEFFGKERGLEHPPHAG
jgi:hypothetical protein